jgi:hypothetical protein
MDLLKKENWWIWLILFIFGQGVGPIVLGFILKVFDKNAWYANPVYWLIGFLMFVFPGFIMLGILSIQIFAMTAKKLDVAGSEFYYSPYTWILLIIVPFFGWILFFVLTTYLNIMILVRLYEGYGEKYI